MTFDISLLSILKTIGQILTAGVAITAFSLFLYALAFNLKDRVARAFVLILFFVVVIYTSEAIGGTSSNPFITLWWLRLKWVGIVFLPATYLLFSDSLLMLTGRPRTWERRAVIWLVFIISIIAICLIPLNILVGPLSSNTEPEPFLERTFITNIFAIYYALIMLLAGINLIRSVKRGVTKSGRRRLIYLLGGATAPAVGTYAFLFHGTWLFSTYPIFFWILLIIGCIVVATFLVIMAYSVAFFGVTWTDRVVKSRLFKWLLRGPVTASLTLAVTTVVRRGGELFGEVYTGFVPLTMILTILLFEYLITILAPFWEKWLFYGTDRDDLSLIRSLEDHLLTRNDLDQFLENMAASICDRLQVTSAFIAVFDGNSIEYVIRTGEEKSFSLLGFNDQVYQEIQNQANEKGIKYFQWSSHKLIPLIHKNGQNGPKVLGIIGFPWIDGIVITDENLEAINQMAEKASIALKNRLLQQQVLHSLEIIQPQVNYIQQLRAVSRYDQEGILTDENQMPMEDFSNWVKDALLHFWGGPKLTKNPLLKLTIVQEAINAHGGNYANALREILKKAIDQLRPEGERRFTGEWILYNILELKFLEGKKVRDIASKLAMSEADLYRKQKVAIEAVAKVIISMEKTSNENVSTKIADEAVLKLR